jgi:phage-related protein
VIKNLKTKNLAAIEHWLNHKQKTLVFYPDITNQIIAQLITEQTTTKVYELPLLSSGANTLASLLGI